MHSPRHYSTSTEFRPVRLISRESWHPFQVKLKEMAMILPPSYESAAETLPAGDIIFS